MASAQKSNPAPPPASGARAVPHIGLEEAVGKARILWQKAKRNLISTATAATYLGYSPTGSSASLVLAALKKFGLIQDEGTSEGRQVRLSELGYQIVADAREKSPERAERLRRAALLPKAHRELWERFGADLPDDESLRAYLMLDRGFAEDVAKLLIKVYCGAIRYAGLDERGTLGDTAADEADDAPAPGRRDDPAEFAMQPLQVPLRAARPEFPPNDASGSPTRVLSIPLGGAKTFDLRFPADLSKEDFDFVLENIKLWERNIVAKGPAASR